MRFHSRHSGSGLCSVLKHIGHGACKTFGHQNCTSRLATLPEAVRFLRNPGKKAWHMDEETYREGQQKGYTKGVGDFDYAGDATSQVSIE